MKRFYTKAEAVADISGFAIHLDGRPVKTPSKQILTAPNEKLATAIAAEWQAQKDIIDPETMPLTQIVTTALEREATVRAAIEKNVLGYLNTDLLCYRATEPEAVVTLQNDLWTPWLDWFETVSGMRLATTTQLTAMVQPAAAHIYAEKIVCGFDLWRFTALQMVTGLSGSLVLALAFVAGAASPDHVFRAAQLEELYRSDLYNEDFYGKAPHQEKTHAAMMRDLTALRQFLDTLS